MQHSGRRIGAVSREYLWRKIQSGEAFALVSDCDKYLAVSNRLVELGYRNVSHYGGGKRDWIEAGLPLEGGRV
jgi:hypothetical protein